MAGLRAGAARATITPPVGIEMVGFAGRGSAQGVHDDLFGTVLALESGDQRAVIVTVDLVFFGEALSAIVGEEIERRTGIPRSHQLHCASHTHYGPSCDPGDDAPDVAAYVENLKHLLAGAASEAVDKLQPAKIGSASGETWIGINRRERRPDGLFILGHNPDGPCDREAGVVRLDALSGDPIAVLVNVACHLVSAGGEMRQISADLVGVMRRMVETFTGAKCLFLQGAAGNINSKEMRHSFEPARKLGTMLGGEVAQRFEEIETEEAEGLAVAGKRIELPTATFPSVQEGERAVAELRDELSGLIATKANGGALWWTKRRLDFAEQRLESMMTGIPLPTIPADIRALRFGDIAIATAPGEIFTEIGMAVKRRSPFSRTLFASYANGSIGYVPVPAAYPEGGYEVTHASRVGPGAAGMIEEAAVELLNGLKD